MMTEAEAHQHIQQARWPDGPCCPKCGATVLTRPRRSPPAQAALAEPTPAQPVSAVPGAAASTGPTYFCHRCGKAYPLLWNTPLQGTRIPLSEWLHTVDLACATPHGMSSRELAAHLGITRKSATFMLSRLHVGRSAHPLRSIWRRALRRQANAASAGPQRQQAKVLLEVLQRTADSSTPRRSEWKEASGNREFCVTLWPLSPQQALEGLLQTSAELHL